MANAAALRRKIPPEGGILLERDVLKMTLDQLPIGRESKIVAVNGRGALRRRLLDMGLTPRTAVLVRKVAPMGDPIEIQLRGYELTLRKEDARNIEIEEG